MSVLLRIYFFGLIAFVPSDSDNAMTIMVVDARDGYAASDGLWVEPHRPLLLARASHCQGECSAEQDWIADFLYRDLLVEAEGHRSVEMLQRAIRGGAAWILDDSDLVFQPLSAATVSREPAGLRISRSASASPTESSTSETTSFDWVPKVAHLAPDAAEIDPDVLSERPRKQLIAARLSLHDGAIRTDHLISDQPIFFRPLRSKASEAVTHSQALPGGIVAEIELPGCGVEWIDQTFDKQRRRSMRLEAEKCEDIDGVKQKIIEVAILNLPKSDFEPARRQKRAQQQTGRHFEIYYELSNRRPPNHQRPVPHLHNPSATTMSELYASGSKASDFLESILGSSKGVVSPPLCPGVEFKGPR